MSVALKIYSVRVASYDMHFIKDTLQIFQYFWVKFDKFCKSKAITLSSAFFTPY